MALIFCPDCGKQFSSKAPACPFCGRPTSTALPKMKDDGRSRCLASASRQAGWGLGLGIVTLAIGLISIITAACESLVSSVVLCLIGMITYFISGPLATVGLIRTAVNRGGVSGKAIAGLIIGFIGYFILIVVLGVVGEMQ